MKRHELLKKLHDENCEFLKHGSRHDIYINPVNLRRAPVPRHNEIPDSLCRLILKQLGIDEK